MSLLGSILVFTTGGVGTSIEFRSDFLNLEYRR